MQSEFLPPNTALTSHSSMSTVDSVEDSSLANCKANKKINKSSFSELCQNSQEQYAAYFLQNHGQNTFPTCLTQKGSKELKKSYYWKIYELAVLYMVSFPKFTKIWDLTLFKSQFKFEFLREPKLNLKVPWLTYLAIEVLWSTLRQDWEFLANKEQRTRVPQT